MRWPWCRSAIQTARRNGVGREKRRPGPHRGSVGDGAMGSMKVGVGGDVGEAVRRGGVVEAAERSSGGGGVLRRRAAAWATWRRRRRRGGRRRWRTSEVASGDGVGAATDGARAELRGDDAVHEGEGGGREVRRR